MFAWTFGLFEGSKNHVLFEFVCYFSSSSFFNDSIIICNECYFQLNFAKDDTFINFFYVLCVNCNRGCELARFAQIESLNP